MVKIKKGTNYTCIGKRVIVTDFSTSYGLMRTFKEYINNGTNVSFIYDKN